MIDIMTTATLRPEILKKTYSSFREKLIKDEPVRIILNVDPVGDDCDPKEVVDIAMEIFKGAPIVWNVPKTPGFSKAFRWCWEQAVCDFVLNLEDDWELLEEIDLNYMKELLSADEILASLRIPFFAAEEKRMVNWNTEVFLWNGKYFECPRQMQRLVGFSGHPSLLKGEFVKKCARLIDITRNPEKQFHADNQALVAEVMRWKFGVYGYPKSRKMLSDIGRPWRAKTGWGKKSPTFFFNQWERIKK